jgi:alkylation response protein AidB-like acyl-CoA dehydrogenase
MRMDLEEFGEAEEEYRAFAAEHVAPHAASIDREGRIPREVIDALKHAGYFASGFNLGDDPVGATIRHGLLHEALGNASASVQGLLNVHSMGGSPIARWGTREQKEFWLPRLTSGEARAAIAITEPNVGSDAASVETTATLDGNEYVINGTKRWVTCGQIADVFMVLATGPTAFIIPRDTAGLTIEPTKSMIGCRGYMLAALRFDNCRVPADQMLGRAGFGLTHVAATGLDAGRYNLAWGCVGLARACLDASFDYARNRRQFGSALSEFQLVQQMITRMMTDVEAARLICFRAGTLRGRRDPAAIKLSTMAKYFASTMVNRVAPAAVQIHGASGLDPDLPLERYLRDARIMEIIEGSTQILEIAIARYGYQERG